MIVAVFGLLCIAFTVVDIHRYGGERALWNMPLERLLFHRANVQFALLCLNFAAVAPPAR